VLEQEEDDGGSSREDEIISMCRNNLRQSENLIVQLVPIFGMYSDNYFVKLPRGSTEILVWIGSWRHLLEIPSAITCLGWRDHYFTGYITL